MKIEKVFIGESEIDSGFLTVKVKTKVAKYGRMVEGGQIEKLDRGQNWQINLIHLYSIILLIEYLGLILDRQSKLVSIFYCSFLHLSPNIAPPFHPLSNPQSLLN